MKKLLITAACAAALLGVAGAQSTTTGTTTDGSLPEVTTSSSTLNNQIKLLRQSYNAKIRALQQEYLTKLKEIVKKDAHASSTRPMNNGKGPNASSTASSTDRGRGQGKPAGTVEGTSTAQLRVLNNQGATTTRATPKGNAWGFLMRFFGGAPRPAATSTH